MEGGIALKKLLCALLAAVLTLTLMIPCTATDFAGFSDQQEIENNNAVRMLYDLGLISGKLEIGRAASARRTPSGAKRSPS
mgnify:CR=1 FL=1